MKKKNEVTISEAIRYFIRENGMEEKVLESMALDGWNDQMGDFLQKYTVQLYVKNRVLYVKLNAPALKNELQFGKSKILTHINNFIGEEFLTEVKFI